MISFQSSPITYLQINAQVLTDSHEFICSLPGLTFAFYQGPSRTPALMQRSLAVEGKQVLGSLAS